MDRIHIMCGMMALSGVVLSLKGALILRRGEATLADALPFFGWIGRLFLRGIPLKGTPARLASIPALLLGLFFLSGSAGLLALRHFAPERLDRIAISAGSNLADPARPDPENPQAPVGALGRLKSLVGAFGGGDAGVIVPEADLGPIPTPSVRESDFGNFIATPGKLSLVVFQLPGNPEVLQLQSMIERVGRRFSNVAQVAYFDLDECPELGTAEGVEQYPDVRFYREGRKVDSFVGLPVKDVILLEKFARHSQGLADDSANVAETPAAAQPSASSLRTPTPAPRELTGPEFKPFIERTDCLAVVVYHADWCQACRKLEPLMKAAALEYGEVAEVGRIDVENAPPELARTSNTDKIPVIHGYRNGKRVFETIGCPSLPQLKRAFDEHTADLRAARAQAIRELPAPPSTGEPKVQPMKKGWMPPGIEKR